MLLIFAKKNTSRLQYIIHYFFRDILNTEFNLINDAKQFEIYTGPKLNYSVQSFENCISICPQGILFEDDIKQIKIAVFDFETTKAFFRTSSPDFSFDLFGASFYLLSRYEEYLPFIADQHGRFEAKQSLSAKYNFLFQPVINYWADSLKKTLRLRFPSIPFKENKYHFIPTIDVDNVYAYTGKGFFRSTGAYLKSVLKLDLETIVDRTYVLLGKRFDPFDGYLEQEYLVKKHQLQLIYFLLFGSRSKYDHNVAPENKKYQTLVQHLSAFSEIGIHPSYRSNGRSSGIISEKEHLEKITKKKVLQSRQHFLKMKLPDTYRNLIESGITEDYSMGYASSPGFRAGTCIPFNFFDLEQNEETNLRIFPFAVMDITFRDYLKIGPKEALAHIEKLITEVKKMNGVFISVWHDRSFSTTHYPGWKQIFEKMIELAK